MTGRESRDDHPARMLQPLAAFVLGLGILKGAAFPHHWAASHLWFNYDHGFVKRGLVGALIAAVDAPFLQGYRFFFYVSVALGFANLVLIVKVFAELHGSAHLWLRWAPILYASSLAGPYLANSIGYMDHLGLLATLLALHIRRFWRRLAFVAACFAVLLFVHEGVFLMFVPVALAGLALEVGTLDDRRRLAALVAVTAGLAVITHVVAGSVIGQREAMTMYRHAVARADFLVSREAFDVLYRTGVENLRIMMGAWSELRYWTDLGYGAITTLPTAALLLFFGWQSLKAAKVGRLRALLVVGAGLAPLSVHAFAWDIHRWNAMAITTSFLALQTVSRYAPQPGERPAVPLVTSERLLAVLSIVFVLNLSSTTWFLNGQQVHAFPFREHVNYWRHLVQGREEFPARPLLPKRLRKLSAKKSPYAKWLRPR